MDLACCFRQSNAFFSGGGLDFGHCVFGNSQLRFRGRCFRSCLQRKMRKLADSSGPGRVVLSRARGGDADGFLWRVKCPRLVNRNLDKFRGGLVRVDCQGSDSLAYIDGNGRNVENVGSSSDENKPIGEGADHGESSGSSEEEGGSSSLDELKELLRNAIRELEVAHLNSMMFEEKAQKISETAIALKDEAVKAWNDVDNALSAIQEIIDEESVAKEAVQTATMALSMAEARVQLAAESLEAARVLSVSADVSNIGRTIEEEEKSLLGAQEEILGCRNKLESCEADLRQLQIKKEEFHKEIERLRAAAEKAQLNAVKADEDVANVMILAEKAVAFEMEATQCVNDAEIALQKEEKLASDISKQLPLSQGQMLIDESFLEEDTRNQEISDVKVEREASITDASLNTELSFEHQSDVTWKNYEESAASDDLSDQDNGKLGVESYKEAEAESELSKNIFQTKKQETQKDLSKDNSPLSAPKTLLKKSSRFLPASFFSSTADEAEFTPDSFFQGLLLSAKKQLPKLVITVMLLGAGGTFLINRVEKNTQLLQQPDIISTSLDEVSSTAKPLVREIRRLPRRVKKLIEMLPHQEINEEEASLFDMLWLLLASVIFVPIFQKLPGGSPVLGYLAAGVLIGPYGLSIIRHVHGTKAIAEFGVVFLLFNIGLELSVERLSSMKKYVFGLGSAQVLVTAAGIGLVAHFVARLPGPAAIVIGNGLALSSTAVVLQVLQERGESTSRHGRATFSVLLFQDLAVVVLLILIPLISPNSSKGGVGFQAIAEALGVAAVKAIIAISAIIAGGRLLLRPIYKQIAENKNAEIFSANTLLVILGTSLLTARAGLSMALGAFLAGLLLAETEFSLQVESDIAPYRGLLLGLFFMTVGMSIDPKLLVSNFPIIMGTLGFLIGGKTILVALVGRLFGVSTIAALRVGLLLAPGGEFAFVAFGEAVNQGIMSPQLSSLLFLVVGVSMALTPWLAEGGQLIASRFEQNDVRSLLPVESETDDLQDHIIICGFGRVGQIIAQLLSERLIPFVALDVRSDRVAMGRALDLPVYFGDAGSREVLHKVGAERACAAAVTLDTPGANYRTVWALNKYFPNVKTFVRAHDVDHGLNLEKAGATAVVPETLEPSLQLAAAVLAQAKLPMSEIASTINEFRSRHLSELAELCETSGSCLGYGFSRLVSKPKNQASDSSDEKEAMEGTLAI
ncbi:hypothetical protein Syun_018951 [Stephania yunnanensis]|uniref:RCK N-terminal domain-containing protein n=1 Tax=Stephania yunnanensis TaxID=152371 RepID=A0AAP0IT68_9MAGN